MRENVTNAVVNSLKDFLEARGFRHDDPAHQPDPSPALTGLTIYLIFTVHM